MGFFSNNPKRSAQGGEIVDGTPGEMKRLQPTCTHPHYSAVPLDGGLDVLCKDCGRQWWQPTAR